MKKILFILVLIPGFAMAAGDNSCTLLRKHGKAQLDHTRSLSECIALATNVVSEAAIAQGNPQSVDINYSVAAHGNVKAFETNVEVIFKPVVKAHHPISDKAIEKR